MSSLPASVRNALSTSNHPSGPTLARKGNASVLRDASYFHDGTGLRLRLSSPRRRSSQAAPTTPRGRFSVGLRALADENPTFGVTNGRFAAGLPVLLLVEPRRRRRSTTEDPPARSKD